MRHSDGMSEDGEPVPPLPPADAVFRQSDAIRDHVFPLFDVGSGGLLAPARFLGTGFFLGRHDFAMTAAHVIRGVEQAVALLAGPSGWLSFAANAAELHPREDLAVLAMQPPGLEHHWSAFVTLKALETRSSLPYHLWGYPEDAALDLAETGQGLRPDLVYSEGHVRRRVTDVPLPSIRGSRFIELSGVAGAGCSGSPVLRRRPGEMWDLCGVYVGERVNERATSVDMP